MNKYTINDVLKSDNYLKIELLERKRKIIKIKNLLISIFLVLNILISITIFFTLRNGIYYFFIIVGVLLLAILYITIPIIKSFDNNLFYDSKDDLNKKEVDIYNIDDVAKMSLINFENCIQINDFEDEKFIVKNFWKKAKFLNSLKNQRESIISSLKLNIKKTK
ncbi:MAG: hypothetical protein K4H23_02010 [Mollicutes bacterium PWAP]|nr:hypothetical protein [Mollicutes bacterium PWAP]